jgi:hypothetical protein
MIDHRLGEVLARDMRDDANTMVVHVRETAEEAARLRGLLDRCLPVLKYLGYDGSVVADIKKELGI